MTVLKNINSKSTKRNMTFKYIIVLVFMIMLCSQVGCIKFGRKEPLKVQEEHHEIKDQSFSSDVKIQEKNDKLNENNEQNEKEKIEIKPSNPELAVKEEKTLSIEPQSIPMSTITSQPEKKEVSTAEKLSHSLDNLFGFEEKEPVKENPVKEEPQKASLTITPEKASVEAQQSIAPSTVPSKEEHQPKESILGELFEIEKNVEQLKKQEVAKEVSTASPEPVNKPEKVSEVEETEKNQPKEKENKEEKQKETEKEKEIDEAKLKNDEKQIKELVKEVSEETKTNEKSQKEEDEEEDDEEESDEKTNKKKNENKELDEEEDDEIFYSKNSKKETKVPAEPHKETETKYYFTLVLTFILYSFIIVMVIITIKCTSSSSKAAKAVNVMVDAVGDAFNKKKGYRPTLNEEEITEREDEITVGYAVDDNKQIFWEKNSVEGI